MSAADYRAPEETLGTVVAKPTAGRGGVKSLLTRGLTNLPIRVPSTDWAAVVTGQKQMFRAYHTSKSAREMPMVPPETPVPRPCLLFAVRHDGPQRSRRWKAMPGVLISHRQEPLGSITPQDLAREGFEFLPAFRFYWKQRYKNLGWRPWDLVNVLEVRPWNVLEDDASWLADWALHALYGEWLDQNNAAHSPLENGWRFFDPPGWEQP